MTCISAESFRNSPQRLLFIFAAFCKRTYIFAAPALPQVSILLPRAILRCCALSTIHADSSNISVFGTRGFVTMQLSVQAGGRPHSGGIKETSPGIRLSLVTKTHITR
jgi:hypothetical protein